MSHSEIFSSSTNNCVHPGAQIASGVEIGPFCLIEEGVCVEEGCYLASHVILRKGTRLEKNVQIDSFSVIGGPPQYRHFDPKIQSKVHIGEGTKIREHVTIHRGMEEGGVTRIGKDCLLMTGSHVAHDCVVGDYVTLTNGVLLAGHVTVESHANLGGGACVHQFVRIGNGAMVGGNATILRDVPPYLIVAERDEAAGLNLVGIKRRSFSTKAVSALKRAYRLVYVANGSWAERADKALQSFSEEEKQEFPEIIHFLEFFKGGKRGNFAQSKMSRLAQ